MTARLTRFGAAATIVVVLLGAAAGCSDGPTSAGGTDAAAKAKTPTTLRDLSEPAPKSRPQGVEDLEVGDCYDPPPDPDQRTVIALVVPCTQAHRFEVYKVFFHEQGAASYRGAPYPGEDEIRNWAEEGCFDAFFGFVGRIWLESDLDIAQWYPTPRSWDEEWDRKVTCVVFDRKNRDLTGSMKGTKR